MSEQLKEEFTATFNQLETYVHDKWDSWDNTYVANQLLALHQMKLKVLKKEVELSDWMQHKISDLIQFYWCPAMYTVKITFGWLVQDLVDKSPN